MKILVKTLVKSVDKRRASVILLALATACSFDTLRAQTNPLIVSSQQLTFNTGVTVPLQTVLVQSQGGSVSVGVSAYSTTNWLQASPTTGNTPFLMVVSVGPGAPTSGTDVGFVNLLAAGSTTPVTIPVVLNANSTGGASHVFASPNSLSFAFPPNSTFPSSQPVSVTTDTASITAYTASAIINNGGSWLSVSPGTGGVPSAFQVTVDPQRLPGPGLFNAVVAISAPGTTGTVVPVLVSLAGPPQIKVDPTQLAFAWQLGTAPPAGQTLLLSSTTGTNVGFTATARTTTCGNNWIVLSQQSGATPSTISVQVNTSGLTPGNCSGEFAITAPGASNPSVSVPVSLLVSLNPLILVPATGPTFTYQLGSASPPSAQSVQITSSGTPVSFAAAATPVGGGPDFLTLSLANGTTPASLGLSVNTGVLPTIGPGTYSETVTIASGGAGNSPQSFPVTLVVNSNPLLTSSVPSLNFNYQVGQTTPQSQTVTIGSTGAPLFFQAAANATNCPGFLSVNPVNGMTFGSLNQIVVGVNTTGITPQACSGNVTITAPGSTTPALVIPVTLNVSNTALLSVSQPAVNVTALTGSAATTQAISVTSTDPGMQLPFAATAATNPIGLTWLAVAPNSGNTPNNLLVTINPANLGVGTYTGSITVSSTAANVPAQTIPVTLNIAFSTVTAAPTSLTFVQATGGPQPISQPVTISGIPAGTTVGAVATMSNGAGWLSASVTGNTVTVSANGTQLSQGTYAGVITVIVPGAAGSPLYVPVTFSVGAAPTLSLSTNTLNFTYQSGSTTLPPAQTVQATSTGGVIPITATFASARGAFATVTPPSGTTPATLSVALNQAVVSTLTAGSYTGTVTVTSTNIAGAGQTVTVNLTVTGPPAPVITSLESAGSLQSGPISPGELVAIKGAGVGPATPPEGISFSLTPQGTVPTTLGGVMVTFNNVPAPLLYVSAGQVNAIVPYEMAGQVSANVVVTLNGVQSAGLRFNIADTTPSLLTLNATGSGIALIRNQDQSVHTERNPAAKGSFITLYGTGEGQVSPPLATGGVTPLTAPFPMPVGNVTVTIGGQNGEIFYAGEAPGLVAGVLAVVVKVPENIGSGLQPIVLRVGNGSNAQQSVSVVVQ